MGELSDYSTSAANNNASPPDGFPEGQAPSTVNDAIRETLARIKRYYEDIGGVNTSGGSSNAYTLTASQTISAYATGQWFAFVANHSNTGAATLSVDSVGAKSIKKAHDEDLAPGDIIANQVVVLYYQATDDVFEMINPAVPNLDGNPLILDADGDTSITADNDDRIDFEAGGSDVARVDGFGAQEFLAKSFSTKGNISIDDDAFDTIDFDGAFRGMLIVVGNVSTAGSGIFALRGGDGNNYATFITGTAGVSVTTGALTGTTGTDGNLTVSTTSSDNKIYIENRKGGTKSYAVMLVGMAGSQISSL